MPMKSALANAGILGAEEIDLLSHVFEEIASSSEYVGDLAAREDLARRILHQFQSGVTDPEELKKRCGKW